MLLLAKEFTCLKHFTRINSYGVGAKMGGPCSWVVWGFKPNKLDERARKGNTVKHTACRAPCRDYALMMCWIYTKALGKQCVLLWFPSLPFVQFFSACILILWVRCQTAASPLGLYPSLRCATFVAYLLAALNALICMPDCRWYV